MIDIATQTLDFYIKNDKIPSKSELNIKNTELKDWKWSVFITLYYAWEIIWSAWNIVELESDIINEIIQSTVSAYLDKRFDNKNLQDKSKIKIRLDHIKSRTSLWNDRKIEQLNPVKNWVLCIKKDYSKRRIILPNISPKLTSWNDFITYLSKKLDEKYDTENYMDYVLETEIFRNF